MLPFEPCDLTLFEPVVAGVFSFVAGVFMGIEEPQRKGNIGSPKLLAHYI